MSGLPDLDAAPRGARLERASPRDLVAAVTAQLYAAGCVSAPAEARWLVEEALELAPGELAGRRGEPVPGPAARARLAAMTARRAAGEPLQYVVGWAPFGPLRLAVGPGVFVPRPETEGLAELAARRLRTQPEPRLAVDLCSGCGAIACFVADAVPGARVLATELDPGALAWGRRNAERHGVELLAGDLDGPLPHDVAGRVQVLTANVPYVPSGQIELLPRDVRDHEPRLALDGGPDGLDVLRRVAALAPRWLAPGGVLLSEIAEDQGDAAGRVLADAGLGEVRLHHDLAGRHRVVEGVRS
jgi:release factor glutamine methyltransferase